MALKTILVAASATIWATAASPTGYQGCFREGSASRILTGPNFSADNMTLEACADFCSASRLYGVEYGTECYCGHRISCDSYQVPDSACESACGGDPDQICGGGNLLSVYKNNFTSQNPRYEWNDLGCYLEPDGGRALERVLSATLMTTKKCLIICSYGSYTFAGLEYGDECWCGFNLDPDVTPSNASCTMPCAGNDTDTCGGSRALNLYTKSADIDSFLDMADKDINKDEIALYVAEELM